MVANATAGAEAEASFAGGNGRPGACSGLRRPIAAPWTQQTACGDQPKPPRPAACPCPLVVQTQGSPTPNEPSHSCHAPGCVQAVGPTGVPLLDGLLGAGAFTGVSASTVLLYASAATGAYALWEQMRFRMARCAGQGAGVQGRASERHAMPPPPPVLPARGTGCWSLHAGMSGTRARCCRQRPAKLLALRASAAAAACLPPCLVCCFNRRRRLRCAAGARARTARWCRALTG